LYSVTLNTICNGKDKAIGIASDPTPATRKGLSHGLPTVRMRCRAVLLKVAGLSSVKAGEQTEMSLLFVKIDNNEQKKSVSFLCKKNFFSFHALGKLKFFI
jgi:hypothetical protein